MENKKDKKKLFLPMLISVVITILICLFSKLFVEDFREVVNYIFLVLIYVYLYVSFYFLFNNFYIVVLRRYFKLLYKMHFIKVACNLNKIKVNDYKKLIYLYIFMIFGVVSFLLFIWQLILRISFTFVTSIVCLGLFLVLFSLSIIMSKNVIDKKNSKKVTK